MATEQSECVSRTPVIEQILFFTKLFFDLCVAWLLTIRDLFTSRRKSVNGQVVVITGGAGAIGKAAGEMFANLGAKVALLDLNEVKRYFQTFYAIFLLFIERLCSFLESRERSRQRNKRKCGSSCRVRLRLYKIGKYERSCCQDTKPS